MRFVIIALLFINSVIFCTSDDSLVRLSDIEKAALRHSEELSIAQLQTLIAKEKIQQIRGINLPKLSAGASYNLRDSHIASVRKNPMYQKTTQAKAPGFSLVPNVASSPAVPKQQKKLVTVVADKEIRTGNVSLVVPVYDFGYGSSLMQAQESLVEASLHDTDRVRQDLLFLVSTTFYRALEASKIEEVVQSSIRILEKQLITAQDLYSVGLVTKNDVLVIEVQLAERQQELIEVIHVLESAQATLHRLTGLSSLVVTQFQDVQEPEEWYVDIEQTIAQANTVHPTLKKILAEKSAATFDVAATKAENFPDINAFCSLHTCSDSYLLHQNWVHAGIGIDIPIFDGGIVDSKVAQKRTALSALDLQYSKAVEDIHLHIRKSFFHVDSAYNRLSVAKKTIALAEDSLAISQDLFEEGQILSDDVLDNEGRLVQAKSNYCQALYEFYMAQSELEYAAGLITMAV